MTTAQKIRGNTAEIPRDMIFLADARNFRGNGNRNPDYQLTLKVFTQKNNHHHEAFPFFRCVKGNLGTTECFLSESPN
jgi:hypothetical protein